MIQPGQKSLRWRLHNECGEGWVLGRLNVVPTAWRRRVEAIHRTRSGKDYPTAFAPNRWLDDLTARMRRLKVPIDLSDSEIIAMAEKCAREALDLAGVGVMTLDAFRGRLERFCGRYGVAPPEPYRPSKKKPGAWVGCPDGPAVRRMTCALWWRRRLRQAQARALEGEAINLGYVHRRAEIYASSVTVERRAQQKARNVKALEAVDAVNLNTGEIYTLAELAEKAVSNPVIRRGELMTRIAGFEAIAQGVGDVALFVTVTCPSRYHAKRVVGGGVVLDNPKWAEARPSPREAQQYLTGMWAKTRAALARAGVAVYGFRIAEPHHDATPHWHLLLFMAHAVKRVFCSVFHRYATAADAHELGSKDAQKARFYVKFIDPKKGTAAGYIAKYVSKNIDGYQVQYDLEGENLSAVTGSQRVEAWASCWGIRQFQQIGGPPVGVWRELRRMAESADHSETIAAGRAAADAGNWRRYVEVQGGPIVPRDDLALRVAYTRAGEKWNAISMEPQPAPVTRYGEVAKGVVFGVRDCRVDRAYVRRIYQWEVRGGHGRAHAAIAGCDSLLAGVEGEAERSEGSEAVNAVNGAYVQEAGPMGSGRLGFDLPWTRVNNCTGPGSAPFWVGDAPGPGGRFVVPIETLDERATRESWEKWRVSDAGKSAATEGPGREL